MRFPKPVLLTASALISLVFMPAGFAQDTDSGTRGPAAGAHEHRHGPGFAQRHNSHNNGFAQRGRHAGPGNISGQAIARLDVNEDGAISQDEFLEGRPNGVDRLFERLDTDGNGLISQDEAERPERSERPQRRQRPHRPEIDREAVLQCVRETIADFDPPGPNIPQERLAYADLNADGNIDLAELSAALNQRALTLFERLDQDGDGLITAQDLQANREQQLNLRRVVRACIDEVA